MFRLNKPISLVISAEAYDEIALAMVSAGAHVTLTGAGLDMRSVGLVRGEDPEPTVQAHRPIAPQPPPARPVTGKRNTAPGAI